MELSSPKRYERHKFRTIMLSATRAAARRLVAAILKLAGTAVLSCDKRCMEPVDKEEPIIVA